jgi:hypothetical protein
VSVPTGFRAPIVVASTPLTFGLVGAYTTRTNPTSQVSVTVNVLPRPRNMLLVLDRTGSMGSIFVGSTTNFEFARQAAHVWADLWVAFRTTLNTSGTTATPIPFPMGSPIDQVGIMMFDDNGSSVWGPLVAVGPNGPMLVDPSTGNQATSLSKEVDFWTAINHTTIPLPGPRSCTPIGDALFAAVSAFGAPVGPERYTVVLMTDGMENCGQYVVYPPAAPSQPTIISALSAAPLLSVAQRLTLHTIGLGSYVDDNTLNALPNAVSGVPGGAGTGIEGLEGGSLTAPGKFLKVLNPTDLMTAFANMTLSTLGANAVANTPAAMLLHPDSSSSADTLAAQYFAISANEQRVAIAVRWGSPAGDQLKLAYSLQSDTTGTYTSLTAAPPAYVAGPFIRDTHGIVIVDLTNSGAATLQGSAFYLRIQHTNTSGAQVLDNNTLCIVDLFVDAEFTLDQPSYQTGDPITITCTLTAGGKPITNATVRVEIDQPGEGLGTFLATNGGGYVQPPPLTPAQVKELISQQRENRQKISQILANSRDPLHPKMQMFQTLLQKKGLAALPVDHPVAIFSDGSDRLFDDTAHRIGPSGRGIYVNTFTNTTKEGAYTWRFVATGKLPNGSQFSRTFTVSTWAGVKIDPASSPVTMTFGTPAPAGYLGATIDVLPKASNGEYLGPFRTGDVSFTVTNGTLQGNIQSTPDGHYTQVVYYKPGETPIVTVNGQGTPFPPTVVTNNPLCRLWHELPCFLRELVAEIDCLVCGCNHPKHKGHHWHEVKPISRAVARFSEIIKKAGL